MKRLIIPFLFCLAACPIFAQFSVHAKYSELTEGGIGVGYDFSKRFWADLTFVREIVEHEDDTEFESALDYIGSRLGFNLSANYNFVTQKRYDVYAGINGGLYVKGGETQASITAPLGVRIRPFENLKNISFQLEFQTTLGHWYPFANVGLHYQF